MENGQSVPTSKVTTQETPKEEKILVDIDFNSVYNYGNIKFYSQILHDFFIAKTYYVGCNQKFTVLSFNGPFYDFKLDGLDLNDISELTYIYPKGDSRPFVLIVNKDNRRYYYGIRDSILTRWTEIKELNNEKEEEQEDLLIYFLKELFTQFFATELRISEIILHNRRHFHDETRFDILLQTNYFEGYDGYTYMPNKITSISQIFINGIPITTSVNTCFAKNVTAIYYSKDDSTPLLIEIVDYPIGTNGTSKYYLKPRTMLSNYWTQVESLNDLCGPALDKGVKSVLDSMVAEYRKTPVKINLRMNTQLNDPKFTKRFGHMPFLVETGIHKNYRICSMTPRVCESFLLQELIINGQKIDIILNASELSEIIFFTPITSMYTVLLICVIGYNSSTGEKSNTFWYMKGMDNKWRQTEFDADPKRDFLKIQYQMNKIYQSTDDLAKKLAQIMYVMLFIFIGIVLTVFAIKNLRKIKRTLRKLFEYFKNKLTWKPKQKE